MINAFINNKKGSALLLTLLVVSLLMVLVLGFVVYVRMQLREASNAQEQRVARRNAWLGMEIALSELQKHAGADQRITAPATTVFPHKDFNELYDADADIDSTLANPSQGMFALYRNRADTSSSRSYLNRVGTYTTPAERGEWDQDIADWWNGPGNSVGKALNPHWVGVFNSALRVDRSSNPQNGPVDLPPQVYEQNPNTTYGEFNRAQLPVWLISGNERFNFNPMTDSSYPAGYFTPDQVLPDPEMESADLETVWLVGEASANLGTPDSPSVDGLDGRVKAPIVELGQGHYAYWVSDESTKANFSVREPDEYATASPGSVEYRNRLQVPQRVGWERMRGFADVFDVNPGMEVNDESFARVVSQSQIGLVNPGFIEPVRENFHHVTSTSSSLLTDPALGGLKKDLTRYLEDGDGLDEDDPIADPARYDVKDSRFAAWRDHPNFDGYGGGNTGFPNLSPEALDGIPTFGELRSWYRNAATGSGPGSIDPDPDSGAVPVLTYVNLQQGLSYQGGENLIRMHWAPMIVLWNPLDVSLNHATYDLDVGIILHLSQFLVANTGMAARSKLAERAALDPSADWREVTVGADGLYNGKPLLKAEKDSDGRIVVRNVTTPGTYEVFRVVFRRPDHRDSDRNVPPDGDTANRYMVKMTGNPESYDLGGGPWVRHDGSLTAKSDAFGRVYYATRPGQTAGMFHSRGWQGSAYNNSWGLLANSDKAFVTLAPHHARDVQKYEAHPVERPFPFRVTTSFEPGEVKVFTLGGAQEWTLTNRLTLVNAYSADDPQFFWTDVLEVIDGPASSESTGLRWYAETTANSPGYNQLSPTVKMSVGGVPFFETSQFGFGGAWGPAKGDDLNRDRPNEGGNANPAYVDSWRPIFDFDNFEDHLQVQTSSITNRSSWAFGEYYLAPFQMRSDLGDGGEDSIHIHHAVLSRFNMGAGGGFEEHPLTERPRSRWGVNNMHPETASSGWEGLVTFRYQRGGSWNSAVWDNNQVDQSTATPRGFTLSAVRDDGSDAIRGLTRVAIRNAKRADSEILSLGQLQQVNLSPYFWQPSFPIGNSDASGFTDREAIAGIHSRIMGADKGTARSMHPGYRPNHARPTPGNMPFPNALINGTLQTVPKHGAMEFWGGFAHRVLIQRYDLGGNSMLDLSYLLNENLWDRYFLSTLADPPDRLEDPLPNARLQFNEHAASAADLLDYDLTSAYLTAAGSLNVNSTSVEAWKALLTSFRDLKLGQGSGRNPDETVPVTRTLSPIDDRVTFTFDNIDDDEIGAVSTRKDYSQVFSGFRYLTDEMIQALAERIVDEVRLRGPFYSLSDFVNRRLAPPHGSGYHGTEWYNARTHGGNDGLMKPTYDPFPGLQGLNGALQRAINLSGINGGVNHPDLGEDGGGTGTPSDMVYSIRIRNRSTGSHYTSGGIGGSANSARGASGGSAGFKHVVDPTRKSHLDTENLAGSPAGEAGQLLQGAPGFVTQGDLLAMIGPALTARGDTFKIRAYGDAGEGARAWLEAIVQRTPEPMEAAGASGEAAWRPASGFGRRFKLVSVRWLLPEEI